ncbi:MAG: biotin/lipoyl-containing protein, partial [Lacunisphaera sp.]
MAEIIEMPKLTDTMSVGTLVKWLKKEGDTVKAGDMLAEVETDKAMMELESFFDGTLLKIFAQAGAELTIGAAL